MLTRILAVATALLAALVVHQYNRIGDLRLQVAEAQTTAGLQARVLAADSMEGQGADVQRAMEWLNDFYKSADGLQRSEGLWIRDHPDFEGIGTWRSIVFVTGCGARPKSRRARRSSTPSSRATSGAPSTRGNASARCTAGQPDRLCGVARNHERRQ